MRKVQYIITALALLALAAMPGIGQDKGKAPAAKGNAAAAKGKAPAQPMSFFITSVSGGKGANYGGLAGADQHCQMLAAAAGAGDRTWHAYLSTQGPNAVNARDRIGTGPWYNATGALIADNLQHLHGDTLDLARAGNGLTKLRALNEKGGTVKGLGDQPNEHDILTGSQPDGRAFTDGMDHTCSNYTSESADGSVQLGHFDRNGSLSWNAAHASRGCGQANLVSTGGAGYLYCFAVGR